MWRRFTGLVALGVTILLVAAACSGSSAGDHYEEAQASGAAEAVRAAEAAAAEGSAANTGGAMVHANVDRVVEVELSEFDIAANSLQFDHGETIEFQVVNTGVAPHEFRLTNQDRVDEHLMAGHGQGHGAPAPGEEVEAEDAILLLEPGKSGTIVFTFPANDADYALAVCLVPGHYEAGMFTDVAYSA
ncbi:MAG: hypothetical protein BMS9Abin20_0023 [Acidimicrobiia bacterium]|nr:MAG: hypothetical protein BMS9Abin20_0023 [Acidimicrobiia bacterium]